LLRLDGISKVFDGHNVALKNVSFCLKRGDFVFLVGSNRSGKSTLLRLITAEYAPTEGEIVFDGVCGRNLKRKQMQLWRRKLGLIFDDAPILNEMDVFDNVALSLRILGMSERKIKPQVRRALQMVGLSTKSRTSPVHLSSAERQKTAFARAMVRNPILLLADEPMSNLDEESTWEMMELLRRINLFGTAVLVTCRMLPENHQSLGRVIRMYKESPVEFACSSSKIVAGQ
jgi:cell division transport system ATP-binding protein